MEIDLAVGQSVECTITTVAFGGNGIARLNKRVIFAPFTVDGDRVVVEITAIKQNYCQAKLKEIVSPSPHRIAPRCPSYSFCGGCQYQHITYDHQLRIKERQVTEAFERIGKISTPPVNPIIPSPKEFNYRGKAEVHLSRSGGGSATAGFVTVDGSAIIAVQQCDLVDEVINQHYAELRETLGSQPVPLPKRRITIWADRTIAPSRITKSVKGKVLIVPFEGFFQANTSLVDRLVDCVIDEARCQPSDTVLDCYCGCGLFSLFLAPRAKKVIGIEEDRQSSTAARHNLRIQGHANFRIYQGRAERVIGTHLIRKGVPIDTVILDPPRTGCSRRVLSDIMKLGPTRIVYVSCNPATQARDVSTLLKGNYRLEVLQPFDMFPQTKHIEVVASLKLEEDKGNEKRRQKGPRPNLGDREAY
ncbi:MAG: class I SAM-dependent RNA methyltransferase [Deltaproteobacteria bacterium]|nr:class I SAM-dependent RNA methyltransferase [Deltaproteobacteria bacterium]